MQTETVSPTTNTVAAGITTGNYATTTTFAGPTGQQATLSTSALPAGATAIFATNPVTGAGGGNNATSNLTISTTCGVTAPGTYTFTVTATETTPQASTATSTTNTLIVTACGVSSVTMAHTSQTVFAGNTSSDYGPTVAWNGPTGQSATLTTSSLPTGATAIFGTNPVTGSGGGNNATSTLTIGTTCGGVSNTPPGTYTFTVTATETTPQSSSATSVTNTLVVNACAVTAVTVGTNSQTVTAGGTTANNLTTINI